MGGISNREVKSGPSRRKRTGRRSPVGLLKTIIELLADSMGGDRREKSSDQGKTDSHDRVASQVCVKTLTHLMTVVAKHCCKKEKVERRMSKKG